MNNPQDSPESIYKKFNTNIAWFIKQLDNKYPYQGEIYRLRQKIKTSHNFHIGYLIKIFAPHIFQYRREILARDEQFFMGETVSEENVRGFVENGDEQLTVYMINKIKEFYRDLEGKEKDFVYAKIVDLLTNCIDFKIMQVGGDIPVWKN